MSPRAEPLVQRLDERRLEAVSGILSQPLFPAGGVRTPFAAAWDVVEPGGACDPHHHHDDEVWFVAEGHGVVEADGVEHPVRAGDAIYLPPLGEHLIRNDADERLVFLTVFWSDMGSLSAAVDAERDAEPRTHAPVLTVGSPPTPNGALHLGHVAGPYLGADACRRHAELQGRPGYTLFGLDEHNSYVAGRAAVLGESTEELADRVSAEIASGADALALRRDVFARPSASAQVRDHFDRMCERLLADGHIVRAARDCLYCPAEERFLFDADATGECPRCGQPASAGGCEGCGEPFAPAELGGARCSACGAEAAGRPLERLFFRLAPFAGRLAEYHAETTMSPRLRALCARALAGELPDIALTYQSGWGVPVPLEGFEDQRFISAFSCGVGWYLGATAQMIEERGLDLSLRELWGPEGTVVQFFGWDNAFLHAITYPAMLMAYAPELRPPDALISNEFYRLEGEKFSTSRDHAVWGLELAERHPADAIRLYLALDRPEVEENSFSVADFEGFLDEVLVREWDGLTDAVAEAVVAHAGGLAPDAGRWNDQLAAFHVDMRRLAGRAAEGYALPTFSLSQVVRASMELVRRTLRLVAETRPLLETEQLRDEARTAIALQLLALKVLAAQVTPVAPGYGGRLRSVLGDGDGEAAAADPGLVEWVPAGTPVDGLAAVGFADARVA
jgi:methionyl-tRNA synthetase